MMVSASLDAISLAISTNVRRIFFRKRGKSSLRTLDLRLVNMGNSSVYHRAQIAVTVPDIVDMNIKKGPQGCAAPEALIVNHGGWPSERRSKGQRDL